MTGDSASATLAHWAATGHLQDPAPEKGDAGYEEYLFSVLDKLVECVETDYYFNEPGIENEIIGWHFDEDRTIEVLRSAFPPPAAPVEQPPTLAQAAALLVEMGIEFEYARWRPTWQRAGVKLNPLRLSVRDIDADVLCDEFGYSLSCDEFNTDPYPTIDALRQKLASLTNREGGR